jgi:hypothetical protein
MKNKKQNADRTHQKRKRHVSMTTYHNHQATETTTFAQGAATATEEGDERGSTMKMEECPCIQCAWEYGEEDPSADPSCHLCRGSGECNEWEAYIYRENQAERRAERAMEARFGGW